MAAVKIKPLIRFNRSIGWQCIGDGWIGCGATMKQAYYEWKHAVWFYGGDFGKYHREKNLLRT